MKFRNQKLKTNLDSLSIIRQATANKIPDYNTENLQGYDAYKQDKWLTLLTILNTSKVQDQFYRSQNELAAKLYSLIEECALEDKLLTAKAIVYSRCVGEGMRSINQLATVFLSKYISGETWAKYFYSLWDKKKQVGGVVFRTDDMAEMIAAYKFFFNKSLPNAMKKGFAKNLESLDAYSLLKYKKAVIDTANMVHPNSSLRKEKINILDAILRGESVLADTWETNQSEAGQMVAKALKEGKLTKKEAESVLNEAKLENWIEMLKENKLPLMATLRNINNIVSLALTKESEVIELLCSFFERKDIFRNSKVTPFHVDVAIEQVLKKFDKSNLITKIVNALNTAMLNSTKNLKNLMTGDTLVIVDMSGSMSTSIRSTTYQAYRTSCLDKAASIASIIVKHTSADLIRFGSYAEYVNYDKSIDLFSAQKLIKKDMGGTNLSLAWDLASKSNKCYNRVIILSDNECNKGNQRIAYKNYVAKLGNPYVYSIDLAGYGTNSLEGENVKYYYGYSYELFDDMANNEFNAYDHLQKVKNIKFF